MAHIYLLSKTPISPAKGTRRVELRANLYANIGSRVQFLEGSVLLNEQAKGGLGFRVAPKGRKQVLACPFGKLSCSSGQ